MKRSEAIYLVLVGTAVGLAGFNSCNRRQYSTTQPTSRTSGSGSYYHRYGTGYWGGSSGGSHSSSTSRGGFGSHGHAAS